MRLLILTNIILIMIPLMVQASNIPPVELRLEAESKLREFVPKLSEIEEKFTDDPQTLLGLAMIYSSYSPVPELFEKATQLYQKAVTLSPNKNYAKIGLINQNIGDFNRERRDAIENLNGSQEFALEHNLKEVEVPSWAEPLYGILKEKDREKVVIHDFNEARATLEKKIDSEFKDILSEIEKAEKMEPENAIYSSIRAQLYFDLDKDDEAIAELEKSSKKTHLNNYWKEIYNAQMRVLIEADFPETYRNIIGKILSSSYRGLPGGIKVFEIAKQNEDMGNIEKAKQIYETITHIANQIREEPIPTENGKSTVKRGENDYSTRIEKQAEENLDKIQGIYPNKSAQQKKPIGFTLPIAGTAVVGIVIAGLVLFLSKKKSHKAE